MESLTQSPQLPQMPQQETIELKGIHLPEPISDFPNAMGWWGLAAMIVFAIITNIIKYRAAKKLRINQKYALKQMQQKPNIEQSVQILKWAAMQYFPRKEIANLYSEQFQQFLIDRLNKPQQAEFVKLSSPAFEGQYKRNHNHDAQQNNTNVINDNFNQAVVLWLKNALPPNNLLANKRLDKNKSTGASQ